MSDGKNITKNTNNNEKKTNINSCYTRYDAVELL